MKYNILIIDDKSENRQILASVLGAEANYNLILAASGKIVIERLAHDKSTLPDLVLLDVMMPDMNGFEVAAIIKNMPEVKHIPIIFITGLSDQENIIKAFDNGGVDYITKPFHIPELLARIRTQLKIVEQNRLLESKKKLLEDEIEKKTRKIEKLTLTMVSALENANLYNDEDTWHHIKRVSQYSWILAREYGCDRQFTEAVKLYSSLHDVGKIGIPEYILKKPGKYTNEEYEVMKNHVEIGFNMLNCEEIDIIGKNIIHYHHEKWDGTGYLKGLKAEEIPLEARIVALSDVYDALTTKRFYKNAFSEKEADRIIQESSGKHFDPQLVKLFFRIKGKILEIDKVLENR